MNSNNKIKYLKNILSIIVLVSFVLFELEYLNIHKFGILTLMHIDNTSSDNIQIDNSSSSEQFDIYDLDYETISTVSETKREKFSYATASETYFENTLFIGDSRMVGFSVYKEIQGVTYFCYQSASAYTVLDKEYNLKPYGNITLRALLTLKKFDKIYMMLGINNVAADPEKHFANYKSIVDVVKETQESSPLYIIANLHVTSEITEKSKRINNVNINRFNDLISGLADNETVFYLDPNPIYDDEEGNMDIELSSDNAHIYVRYYDRLLYFLLTHVVVFE